MRVKPVFLPTPIIFSTPMVQAILSGAKTQTRRIVKPQPNKDEYVEISKGHFVPIEKIVRYCPYGTIKSKLWVKETFSPFADKFTQKAVHAENEKCNYKADYVDGCPAGEIGGDNKWHPSIFMPQKLSRITLEITNIRVERLQDITEGDAIKEGFEYAIYNPSYMQLRANTGSSYPRPVVISKSFMGYWDSINAKRGYSWGSNPWVWVLSFKVI